jgi:hypothetical protein
MEPLALPSRRLQRLQRECAEAARQPLVLGAALALLAVLGLMAFLT